MTFTRQQRSLQVLPASARCPISISIGAQRWATDDAANTAIAPRSPPTVSSADGTRTLRARQHGRRSLPLPPSLDPRLVAARERHKQPKPHQKSEDLTDFQKQLALNPYARALATTVRRCSFTRVKLPSHFLLPFGTIFEAESADLEGKSAPRVKARLVERHACELHGKAAAPDTSYLLNDHKILEHVKAKSRWTVLVSHRMREWFAQKAQGNAKGVEARKDWNCDPNLHVSVSERLRSEAIEPLRALLQHHKGALFTYQEFCGFDVKPAVGCLLHMSPTDKAVPGVDHQPESGESARLAHGTENARGIIRHKVKQFDLRALLGPGSELWDMIGPSAFAHAKLLVVVNHHRTLKLQLALSRLQGHLATDSIQDPHG